MNKPKKNQIKKLNSLIVDHRNFVAAREFAEELNKDYPENTEIINSLASVYIFFKEIDKSIKLLEGIKLKNKDNEVTNYFLAQCYQEKTNYKEFLTNLFNSLKINKNYYPAIELFFLYLEKEENILDHNLKSEIYHNLWLILNEKLIPLSKIKSIIEKIIVREFKEIQEVNIDGSDLDNILKKHNQENINSIYKEITNLSNEDSLLYYLLNSINIANLELEVIVIRIRVILILFYQQKLLNSESFEESIPFLLSLISQNSLRGNIWFEDEFESSIIDEFKSEILMKINKNESLSNFEIMNFVASFNEKEDIKNLDAILKTVDKKHRKFVLNFKNNLGVEKHVQNKFKNSHQISNEHSINVEKYYRANQLNKWQEFIRKDNEELDFHLYNSIKPTEIYKKRNTDPNKKIGILDIGCGMGEQALYLSSILNSQVTAIDLDEKNISFCINKAKEVNIKNVSFYKMDIFDVEKKDNQYDLINVKNVIEELEDHNLAFQMIYNLLEPKGLVNISTKSKIAYQNVSKALELASKEINIDEKDDKTLKELRSLVRKSNNNIIKYLGILPQFNNRNDLYHLLFPISKSFLDIPKLSELIKKNKFKFIGWGRFVPQEIKKTIYHQYKKEYPEDENYKNLENWNSFEKRHPSIFVNDYDFWLEKS